MRRLRWIIWGGVKEARAGGVRGFVDRGNLWKYSTQEGLRYLWHIDTSALGGGVHSEGVLGVKGLVLVVLVVGWYTRRVAISKCEKNTDWTKITMIGL